MSPSALAKRKGFEGHDVSNFVAKIAYFLMCYSWFFDFRSEGAGSSLGTQQFFIIFYLISFINFTISHKDNGVHVRGLGLTIILSLLFILIGTIAGLVSDQDVYLIFRNGANIFIYITMTYATSKIIVTSGRRQLVNGFIMMTFLYTISTLIIYYVRQGSIDFDTVRFQIIGPSTIAASALIILSFIYRLPRMGYAAIITSSLIVFVSVTRTYIVVVLFQFVPLLKDIRKIAGPREFTIAILLITSIPTIYVYTEFISNRWEDRVSVQSESEDIDPTLYARMDEWGFMAEKTFRSPVNVLFGSGLAAETEYYLPDDISKAKESDIGFGHSNHFSLIFIAGFIGGLPLLILHIIQFIQSFKFVSSVFKGRMKDSDVLFLATWGALIIIGTFIANVLSSSFTNRGSSMWYAIGTGLFLGGRACFDPENRQLLLRSIPTFYNQLAVTRRQRLVHSHSPRKRTNLNPERLPAAVARRRRALAPHSDGAA